MTPPTREDFIAAGAANDHDSERLGGAGAVLVSLGINVEDMSYVAEQRALRAVLVSSGRLNELGQLLRGPVTIELSEAEQIWLTILTGAYMDGITLGYRTLRENA